MTFLVPLPWSSEVKSEIKVVSRASCGHPWGLRENYLEIDFIVVSAFLIEGSDIYQLLLVPRINILPSWSYRQSKVSVYVKLGKLCCASDFQWCALEIQSKNLSSPTFFWVITLKRFRIYSWDHLKDIFGPRFLGWSLKNVGEDRFKDSIFAHLLTFFTGGIAQGTHLLTFFHRRNSTGRTFTYFFSQKEQQYSFLFLYLLTCPSSAVGLRNSLKQSGQANLPFNSEPVTEI